MLARAGGVVLVLSVLGVGGRRAVPVRGFNTSLALGSVSAVTRQSDLSVLVVDSSDRGAAGPRTEHRAALGDQPDPQLTGPRRGADIESMGARIDALRLREPCRSRCPEQRWGLDGMEVQHPGSSSDEKVYLWATDADAVVMPCDRGSRFRCGQPCRGSEDALAGVPSVGRGSRQDRLTSRVRDYRHRFRSPGTAP
jgi:hypothetical protein